MTGPALPEFILLLNFGFTAVMDSGSEVYITKKYSHRKRWECGTAKYD